MTKYPLTWPTGWKRTQAYSRTRAKFSKATTKYHDNPNDTTQNHSYKVRGQVTIAEGAGRVLKSLEMLGAVGEAIISTNLHLKLDGLPRSGQQEPADPGVAVYWKTRTAKQHKVMAIDRYDRVADNLAAIAATLEAMRAIERHGGAVILERAFTGFEALPSPNDWRHVMGFENTPTLEQAKDRYRQLAQSRHPDRGGHENAMQELNRAYDDAKRELTP